MKYIRKRGKHFHFRKRIPEIYKDFFTQEYIQVSLKTDSAKLAIQRGRHFNELFDQFLYSVPTLTTNPADKLKELILQCRQSGFGYASMQDIIARRPATELIERIQLASSDDATAEMAKVLLGTMEDKSTSLIKMKEQYFRFEKSNKSSYSENQWRKWKNPRNSAVKNFISVIGDKPILELNRNDILAFRKWWADKVENGYSANSANKQFSVIRQILQFASDNSLADIKPHELFRKIALKEVHKEVRKAFDPLFIQEKLLDPNNYPDNEECFLFVCAMADTGARISELVGLADSDVNLDCEIPYIVIRPNSIRDLKTPQSKREIPLVGSSLFAFQTLQGGFKHYQGKSDLISNTINKYARENNLFPSKQHSLYSLRHSFEDRLTAVEINEKIQAALMGHKYSRPRYGNGPSLEQKQFWLQKIAFKALG